MNPSYTSWLSFISDLQTRLQVLSESSFRESPDHWLEPPQRRRRLNILGTTLLKAFLGMSTRNNIWKISVNGEWEKNLKWCWNGTNKLSTEDYIYFEIEKTLWQPSGSPTFLLTYDFIFKVTYIYQSSLAIPEGKNNTIKPARRKSFTALRKRVKFPADIWP